MSTRHDPADYAHARQVSRLPALPAELDPMQKENFDRVLARGGQILNLHRVSGHAPALAKARGEFVWALRDACLATRQMRELAIVRVAYLMACDYELDHHLPLASRAGLSDAQIQALPDWRSSQKLFDSAQQALLAYLDAMFDNKGDVDHDTFQNLLAHFSPQEIVELTMCATSYYANAYYVKALKVQIDQPHVKAAPGRF